MKKINKITLKELLDSTDLLMHLSDILYFCDDVETINEFVNSTRKNSDLNYKEIKDFLIKHENKINKQKLLLLIVKNYSDNIQLIDSILKDNTYKSKSNNSETLELIIQKQKQEQNLNIAKKIGKGMDESFAFYFYNTDTNRYDINIIDSKELIDGIKINSSANLKRFKEINQDFMESDKTETVGIEYLLQSIVLTDFNNIFPNEQIGDNMRTLLLENQILKNNVKTRKEIENLKKQNYDEYENLIENNKFHDILSDMKNLLEKYIKYVDIDKLLAISAYRFEESLENEFISIENAPAIKEILNTIIKHTKNNKTLTLSLQDRKNNSYDLKDIEYSLTDIINCVNRFTDDSYIKKSQIEEYKNKINSEELTLFDLDPQYVKICFSPSELENIAKLNSQNLQYVSTILQWNKDKILNNIKFQKNCPVELLKDFMTKKIIYPNDIISLYKDNIIDIEYIKNLKEYSNFSNEISASELISLYDNYNKNKSEENNLINYTRYLDLYKEILLNDNPKETEKYSLNFMEQMIENYDKRHIDTHITQLEEFYKQGLLTLNTIIEWNDPSVIETFLTDLYKENIIQLNDVKKFVKNGNLPFEYIKQLVWEENINYEERLKLLEEGWIPEEEIFELYSKALIREDDLLKLSQKSIISKQKTLDIINNTQLQDLEKYSNIVLVIGDKLQKIKRDDSLYFNEEKNTSSKSSKPKLMIDPNERESLFSLLKAGKPNKVEISETSPFYNYEFYIIPDESGKVNLNSVIIAERIYEEKEEHIKNPNTTIKYATDNATYFFKYTDLMVLSNYLKKDDAIKETKNIIFKANHTLANDKRNGHWAASVIYGVAKTMLSSDLKEYSKDNQRKIIVEKLSKVYTYDELEKILDKGSSIDSGDSICEIIDYDDSDSR